jgi:hypothetical protein
LYHLEGNLECNATYGNDGHVSIRGIFSKQNMLDISLNFILNQINHTYNQH